MTTAAEKVANYMDDQMVNPLRRQLIGRKLVYKQIDVPEGTFNVDRLSITEMGDATISYTMPDEGMARDLIGDALTNEKLAVIAKGYKIPYQMVKTYLKEGIDIDNSTMLSAAHVCADKEDAMIIDGWKPNGSTYEINGMYQAAGNTVSTSAGFDTYGNASIAVAEAMAALDADSVDGVNFNLVLHPDQYWELMKSKSTTGEREKPAVLDLLNSVQGAPPGDIFKTTKLTTGYGLICPVDPDGGMVDLVRAMDFTNIPGTDSMLGSISPVYLTMCAVERLRIKQTNAFCKLTAI